MAFYYKFVVPNRSFIELDRRLPIGKPLMPISQNMGMQWEKLCRCRNSNPINGVIYGKAKRCGVLYK